MRFKGPLKLVGTGVATFSVAYTHQGYSRRLRQDRPVGMAGASRRDTSRPRSPEQKVAKEKEKEKNTEQPRS